jgi:hypothetical protein
MVFEWFKKRAAAVTDRVTTTVVKVTQQAPPTYEDVECENALQSIRTRYEGLHIPAYERWLNFGYHINVFDGTTTKYIDKLISRHAGCAILASKLSTLRMEYVLLKGTTSESELLDQQIGKDIDMLLKVAKDIDMLLKVAAPL